MFIVVIVFVMLGICCTYRMRYATTRVWHLFDYITIHTNIDLATTHASLLSEPLKIRKQFYSFWSKIQRKTTDQVLFDHLTLEEGGDVNKTDGGSVDVATNKASVTFLCLSRRIQLQHPTNLGTLA